MMLLVHKELNISSSKLKCGAVEDADPQCSHCSGNFIVQQLTQLLKIPLLINSQNFIFSSGIWVRKEQLSIFFTLWGSFTTILFIALKMLIF